jgi:DNA-nicking Smr family endonuclease
MSRRRHVSEEEAALWRAVTRTVAPLKRYRRKAVPVRTEPVQEPRPAPHPSTSHTSHRPSSSVATRPVAKPNPSKPNPSKLKPSEPKPSEPALAPIDRRAKQRLARGTQAIDARIDLHGRTQSEAHLALLRFLRRAQANEAKTVLVITGKGRGSAGDRGVLKRQVPMWLALPEFRGLVVGYGEAAAAHGGEGALYVRVRRVRPS